MSDAKPSPMSGKGRIFTSETEFTTYETYSPAKAAEFGVNENHIKSIHSAIRAGVDFDDSVIDNGELRKKLVVAYNALKEEWEAHKKNKAAFQAAADADTAAKKAEREAKAAAIEQSKKDGAEALSVAIHDPNLPINKPIEAISTTATQAFSSLLGDKIRMDSDGELSVVEGAELSLADFATAFGGFAKFEQASSALKEKAALTEARVGVLAKKNIGERWTDLFSASPQDKARVTGNVRTVETAELVGEDGHALLRILPLTNVYKALRVSITSAGEQGGDASKADEINLQAKKDVAKLVRDAVAKAQEAGETLPQKAIDNIVAEYKKSKGVEAKMKYNYIYVFLVGGKYEIAGSVKPNDDLQRTCLFCISSAGNILRMNIAMTASQSCAVEEPSEALLTWVRDTLPSRTPADTSEKKADKVPAKKAAKKAATTVEKAKSEAPSLDEVANDSMDGIDEAPTTASGDDDVEDVVVPSGDDGFDD